MPHGRHIYAKSSGMAKSKIVHIHSQIMHYQDVNLYFSVLIVLTKKHMINIPTQLLQFDFTFIV